MPIATNPTDGSIVFLGDDGNWQPAKTAVNPETQEMLAFDGAAWKAVPASKGVFQRIDEAFKSVGVEVPKEEMSLGDVATSAVRNAPSSALQFGKDLVQPIIHPIETAEAIKNLGHGVLQKVGLLSGDDQVKYADAVGKFFVDRYGSIEGVKKAVATDPVGVLGDVALVLSGGGGLAARAPGIAGRVGEIAGAVGRAVDPVNVAIRGTQVAGRGAASVIGGLGTHTGAAPIVEAARAGAEGGQRAQIFRENMRGEAPIQDVVTEARAAVDEMRRQRGTEYRTAMQQIGQDQTVLDFAHIDQAVRNVQNVKNYRGQDLSPTTQGVRQQMTEAINNWRGLDPAQFHTAEGLDALKQMLGDIRDSTNFHTPERVIADRIYGAVRQTIVHQAPEYGHIMHGYEQASALIHDIERTLSLNPRAAVDTAVRKLQSVLSNNVNTNYGRREALANYLVNAGAQHLITRLAGQSLNTMMPRGMGKVTAAIAAGAAGSGGLFGLPALVSAGAVLPFTSPRLVGEVAHGLGRISRAAPTLGRSAFQAGRESRQEKR